ncbi:hypothetical protein INS49_013976 [Diaporthe citri]|uniref:uncharacterized protein n=1 Tax=Diaporthe citri TaxID=83186 RepID=UPI001C80A8FF|nr:uncharacterized protein INS49_013976 [Diaporthe citri]KAG6358092.1 hypothetical protein INS49_013976 [Diaporthe citri]
MTSSVPMSPHVKDSSGRRVASAMHSAVFEEGSPIVSFSYTRAAMEKEDLTFPLVLDKVRGPGLWDLSPAGRGVYGSVTIHEGPDDRFPLLLHNDTVNGVVIEDNIITAGNIKQFYTTPISLQGSQLLESGGIAAARQKEIAEGYSSALEEIGKEMNFSTHELKTHRTKRMERLVMRLYIRHAKFFCHFMTWYLSSSFKRFGSSLRNDFYTKEVQQMVTDIRSVAKEIEQEASLITRITTQRIEAMVRSLGPTVEESARRADFYHNIVADRLDMIDKSLEILTQGIGQLSRDHVVDHCENLLYSADVANALGEWRKTLSLPLHSTSGAELAVCRGMLADQRVEGSQPSNSPGNPSEKSGTQHFGTPTLLAGNLVFTRTSLQQVSGDLQAYYPSTAPGESSQGIRDLATRTVSGLVVVRLKEWLASPRSDFLWIIGSNSPFGNEATLAASHIFDITTSARLPCVSFSCTPTSAFPHTPGDGKTRCTILLIALLYSIIHQLLCFVPETFEDACELEDAIQSMDGGEKSTPNALEIIQALLRHRTPLLLIILDGLELIEDGTTVPHLRNLISIIHSRQTDSRLKVLLGSQGFLESGGQLDVDER